ncbi:helix-turn-helix domain-containing protein [Methylophilus sp. 'Pure River']|jgi:transcriptional regulator with XRE-family HTH domain|uniref:helix-turn-helix domain-containing protein n=1 Tax=Methylophilus sp. 'Pure River' TaxID=3377117 RepID=UPI00398EF93C
MEFKKALGVAIREARVAKNITQESISAFSSRTYLSDLENGKKDASVSKINALATSIGVHPLTIFALAYLHVEQESNIEDLQRKIAKELTHIKKATQVDL